MNATDPLLQSIDRLRQLTQSSIQTGWRYWDGELPIDEALQVEGWGNWTIADVNAKDHLPWVRGRVVRWFSQQVVIPETLQGYPVAGLTLRIALLWWAEQAQIYVNGKLVQEGDLFDCAPRLLLGETVQPGDTFNLAIRLLSPGHDEGALMRSRLVYEVPPGQEGWEPGFVADELAVLRSYLMAFAPEHLETLTDRVTPIPWNLLPDRPVFDRALAQLRQAVEPLAIGMKERTIGLVGHAHLDLAWLWPVADTWEAADRTFQSVLNLQKEFPDLTFCHSTPALYAWVEAHRPDLFKAIQDQVKTGRWEIVGGLWVEPDLNLVSGESIARQLLYGQRYTREKFGKLDTIAWLPDTFGFCWQLPQLLLQGGVKYFVTQKLRWNDTNQYPNELFWWQAPDGSQILALMSAPIGEGIDPVKMGQYAWDWEQRTRMTDSLWLPGVGDHGGGPTRDMLESADRWRKSPFFPEMRSRTALDYLESLPLSSLPTWNNELYLEFHRGCYTTHADQKQANRTCEGLLYQAELFASLATLGAGVPYPQQELETAWKQTLFNQFHDILPGSAIPQVFEEANQAWEEVKHRGRGILRQSLETIAAQIQLPESPLFGAYPVVVFNALNWERSEVVQLEFAQFRALGAFWRVYDSEGKPVTSQISDREQALLFKADRVPSVGYRVFWVCPGEATPTTAPLPFVLENEFLRVQIQPETGDLQSIWDKQAQREVLAGRGNQLQAFEDKGQYWDAWNIDPNYADHPLPVLSLPETGLETGELQTRFWVRRRIGNSLFHQEYVLQAGSPLLKIETVVEWVDRHVLVKAAFPLTIEADIATYEIPFGSIERSTRGETPEAKAQWEVPGLRWADLSDGTYGVSLLNDSKYGYDAQPNQLRLTLLRGAEWPDPEADRGVHGFTYALYPHAGEWRSAQTVRRGYELNLPLQTVLLTEMGASEKKLPPIGQFLYLGAENLVLSALKQSEDDPEQWIIRCYETQGKDALLEFRSDFPLTIGERVDLLEQAIEPTALSNGEGLLVQPWKIASFRVEKK
ncbi:MAG: alpha-mannosidase [Leptolyngbyaceae cyanobacterium bins.59]|nr:alpha-mannosidase [Leptolyngbyaceae cyanobacterium bins.59]